MVNRSKHLPPETGTFNQPDFSSAFVQVRCHRMIFPSSTSMRSHAFGFPTVQAQVANVAPIFQTYHYPQSEASYSPGIILKMYLLIP